VLFTDICQYSRKIFSLDCPVKISLFFHKNEEKWRKIGIAKNISLLYPSTEYINFVYLCSPIYMLFTDICQYSRKIFSLDCPVKISLIFHKNKEKWRKIGIVKNISLLYPSTEYINFVYFCSPIYMLFTDICQYSRKIFSLDCPVKISLFFHKNKEKWRKNGIAKNISLLYMSTENINLAYYCSPT
jgi:Holliday junction resolvase RusA-like endonuclease